MVPKVLHCYLTLQLQLSITMLEIIAGCNLKLYTWFGAKGTKLTKDQSFGAKKLEITETQMVYDIVYRHQNKNLNWSYYSHEGKQRAK